jgi:oligopeptide/dipeptide ABC transporter ATP-binding protein
MLLEVRDLDVTFGTPDGSVHAVRGVSFDVDRGRTLGLVGESGSGKSVCVRAITGLTRGAVVRGEAVFEGRDLLRLDGDSLRAVRGAEIGMIFQDARAGLHPLLRIGAQIAEATRAHDKAISRKQARARAVALLADVGIGEPERRVDDYPHQCSGGMCQRVMIAIAMAMRPKVLIADEPTSSLDVIVQADVLDLMRKMQRELGTAIVMISHDVRVINEMADDIVVMYAGRVMEAGSRRDLLVHPHHPYTNGLLASQPDATPRGQRLNPIPGHPPSLIAPPEGCPFHPRCPATAERCVLVPPPLRAVSRRHHSACWLPEQDEATG